MAIPDGDKQHFSVIIKGLYAASGLTSKTTINILYYRRTAFTTPLDYAELLAAIQAKFEAEWLDAVSSSWEWVETAVRNIDSPFDGGALLAVGNPGTIAGDPLPPFVAQLISKKSAVRGRSFHGRLYVAGLPESGNVSSKLTAGQLILLQALATALTGQITTAAGLTYVPFLFSQFLSDITVEPAIVNGADITSFIASDQVASMVSRRLAHV